jgi:hypothetical protein
MDKPPLGKKHWGILTPYCKGTETNTFLLDTSGSGGEQTAQHRTEVVLTVPYIKSLGSKYSQVILIRKYLRLAA